MNSFEAAGNDLEKPLTLSAEEILTLLSIYDALRKTCNRIRITTYLESIREVLNEESYMRIAELCSKYQLGSKLLYSFLIYYHKHNKFPTCISCHKPIIQKGNRTEQFNELAEFCSPGCVNTEHINAKILKTFIEHYGVTNAMHVSAFRKKQESTQKERYGGHHWRLPHIRDKRKATYQVTLGVDNPLKNKSIQEKVRTTKLNKYGYAYFDYVAVATSNRRNGENSIDARCTSANLKLLEEYKGVKHSLYTVGCATCNNSFYGSFDNGLTPICRKCNPYSRSSVEKLVCSWLDNLGISYQTNSKQLLEQRLELDIFCIEKNLAIEVNGLYWHSTNELERLNFFKTRHLNKLNHCNAKGIQLIQLTDEELLHKSTASKGIIQTALGANQHRIGARNCTIKVLDTSTTKDFLNKHHIQGNCPSPIRIGLYYKDLLVQVMTFGKPRYNKKSNYELLRLCTLFNYTVIGGSSKLFKYFTKNYLASGATVVSYCDRRLFKGTVYEKLGFNLTHISKPNYKYYKDNTVHSRVSFQKHKLRDKLPLYDAHKTEIENMLHNGYRVMWDCGNSVFLFTNPN